MSDLNIQAWVSRTELSLSNLDINDGDKYVLGRGMNPGAVSWRKQTVESPFYPGRYVVHEVKDAVEISIPVYVQANNYSNLNVHLETLLEAFTNQSSFLFTLVIDGYTNSWTCERADYEIGFAAETVLALRLPVQFKTMRVPTPASGVM